ncbi:MAG: hypothetical protein EA376_06350 [Phycisphaeraceae bacterium]|nr:MAG: hypothetical protein EA376_06350 [Phycisphaeraceae bacterium]
MPFVRSASALGVACVAVAVGASAASAATHIFRLSDHPDGNAAPPTYGLRLDNMFSAHGAGPSGITTFSFVDVLLTVNDETAMGGGIDINISGLIYGGVDTGASYGFGEGFYTVDFNYIMGVQPDGDGWKTNPVSATNSGVVTALGNADVAAGEQFFFYEKVSGGMSMRFVPDGHRLSGDNSTWVGRGWHTYDPQGGAAGGGSQDWLFVGHLVPAPAPFALCAAGLTGVMILGRRRRA